MIKKKEPRSKVVYTRMTETNYKKLVKIAKRNKVSNSIVLEHMVEEYK